MSVTIESVAGTIVWEIETLAAVSHSTPFACSCINRRVTCTEWPIPIANSNIGVSTIMVVSLNAVKPIRPRVKMMVAPTPSIGKSAPRQLRNSNQSAATTITNEMTKSHHLLTRSANIQARK